jgi:phytoene synthase
MATRPAPGSDFYYALLYGPAARRDQLAAINELRVELCTIGLTVSDVGVARIKLDWWRGETERLVSGDPRHRLTQAYYDNYRAEPTIGDALLALVNGLDEELGGRTLATDDDQWAWFDVTFGPLYTVHALVSAQAGGISAGPWRRLGRWIEIGYSLLYLKPMAQRKLRRLPAAKLAAANCTWDDIEAGRNSAAVVKLLDTETRIAIENIADIISRAPRRIRRDQRPLFTLGRIVQQSLVEMREDGCRIWQHRIELTPLRKLWIAWRMGFT